MPDNAETFKVTSPQGQFVDLAQLVARAPCWGIWNRAESR